MGYKELSALSSMLFFWKFVMFNNSTYEISKKKFVFGFLKQDLTVYPMTYMQSS